MLNKNLFELTNDELDEVMIKIKRARRIKFETEIDCLVYELCGLTDEEIAIVEDSVK